MLSFPLLAVVANARSCHRMLWEARATVKSSICGMAMAAVTRSATHTHTHAAGPIEA